MPGQAERGWALRHSMAQLAASPSVQGPSACDELLREKEDECLDRLNECSNTYAPLLLKSLKLIALLDVRLTRWPRAG